MKAGRELRLAVVGATGAVGQTMIQVLEELGSVLAGMAPSGKAP